MNSSSDPTKAEIAVYAALLPAYAVRRWKKGTVVDQIAADLRGLGHEWVHRDDIVRWIIESGEKGE